MKYLYLIFVVVCLNTFNASAQQRSISGTIIDSTKLSLPGSNIKLRNELGDSTVTIADVNGKFTFPSVKGSKITIVISSIGYDGLIKHYNLPADGKAIVLDPILLKSSVRQLGQVTIVGINPVVFKEDTVQYSVSAYKVRENAPIEDVLKKIPGLDVAKDGTVSSQGKQITKVRVNGKDFFGGDVQSATKNLPADVIESVQIIDDYGDQANLTGVKTGEPAKILNFTIRKDKNFGYFGQATAGEGRDWLPKQDGADVKNDNRYIGLVNFFKFKGDQQISVLGNLNNTNVNTFSYGAATGAATGGGGFGGGGGGGGGGRGNAARGGSSGSTTNANGITNARSIGLNFRDQWAKTLSVYGSYSFSNNTTYTNSTTLQNNNSEINSSQSTQKSQETSMPTNHRFNFNLEWKPDTLNYLKVTPTFTYTGTNVTSIDDLSLSRKGITSLAYTSNSVSNSTAPSYGLNGFFNHRFKNSKRNLLFGFNVSTNKSSQFDNPINDYTVGVTNLPKNQVIYTDTRTNTYGLNMSYQEPIGKVSFLELNYAFNHNFTSSDKETDTLYTSNPDLYHNYALLSNNYNYTFTTNRFGLNYRVVEKKYNLTLGVGAQPAKLDGINLTNNVSTSVSTFNIIPAASFNYNFSRSQALRFNYNGSSNQPAFNQLQPVLDFSNASYPVQGNPNLSPEFANNLSLRYNAFSFQTGNIFLVGVNFSQTDNKIVQNIINYAPNFTAAAIAADPSLINFRNTTLVKYLNTSGYYTAGANLIYSKPWKERRYTLTFNANATYTNNIGFSQSVDSLNVMTPIAKNIAKTISLIPRLGFRTNITDIIDAELYGRYTVSKTNNSLTTLGNQNTNIRSVELGLNGKNYVWKDWTISYDYTKTLNYGYDAALNIKNPNILNTYLERRFLKDHRGTLRLAAYDLFNENTGFATTTNGSTVTQTNVNRLGRYYLLTFTLRLQKFSGKAPTADPSRGMRDGGSKPGGMGGPAPGGGPI
ncbi:outer membrane beta-barrel protein [Mucilaginibacter sp. RB4R14]|uniref:outer membrane beta-barrel protein n=1 Tax=Mucilaginibacter aurantiaciroseus TaxID=2949308 RepID=UPI00209024E6|nr:outer membrane beta-barrel protein [Mucilaginibacter aurantiaciroseus]MCO5936798.1 outer membrane beta-barrel protein [Mucilaginibacter aurantiaciroseus]